MTNFLRQELKRTQDYTCRIDVEKMVTELRKLPVEPVYDVIGEILCDSTLTEWENKNLDLLLYSLPEDLEDKLRDLKIDQLDLTNSLLADVPTELIEECCGFNEDDKERLDALIEYVEVNKISTEVLYDAIAHLDMKLLLDMPVYRSKTEVEIFDKMNKRMEESD